MMFVFVQQVKIFSVVPRGWVHLGFIQSERHCLNIKDIKVVIARGIHLFPFRTEKLSPAAPMVLRKSGRVGSRRDRKSTRLNSSH